MPKISVLALTKSTGGTAAYNRRMLSALDPARFESHTLCLSENSEEYARQLAACGLSAEPLAMARYRLSPAGDLAVLRHTLDVTRRRQIDVVVSAGSKAGFIARAVGRITGVPVVYRQASMPFLHRIQGGKAPFYWALEFAARGFGGRIVTLTEAARRTTLAYGLVSPDRVSVIRTGIDTAAFRPRGRRDEVLAGFGLDPRRPVVGWLARMEPQKAPEDFVSAIERAAPRHPDAQFVMAGGGAMEDEIVRRVAAAGLSERVRFLPWQSDSARVLEGFDIFALSSRWEGLPLTLLEAMACGCAPVSTVVDGCAEVVEDGVSGLLVPAGDPGAMADALDALLADPARRRAMAEAARRRMEEHFDTRQMMARWSDLLTELVERRAGRARAAA